MKLDELFKEKFHENTLLDIMAQIIEIYKKNENDISFVMRPENFKAEKAKESIELQEEYFDISYCKEMPFDGKFSPVPDCGRHDERDNVFCMGVILYQLASGDVPDCAKARELAEFIENDDDSFKFLTYEKAYGESPVEKSLLWDIISHSTELNKNSRPSFNDIMRRTVSAFPTEAKIRITENVFHECINEVTVQIKSAFNVWQSEKSYQYSENRYIPEKTDSCIEIPYRLFTKEYICTVSPDKSPEPELVPMTRNTGRHNIGIDFGTWSSCVSFINENGYSEDIFPDDGSIPTAIYYISENDCLFGNDALMHSSESVARCFKRNIETGSIIEITAENGDTVKETYYGCAVRYLKYLYGEIQKKFSVTKDNSEIVLTIPACYDAGMKTLILSAAREAGFEPDILTEPEAAAFFFGVRNNADKNALVFDIGGGTADISFISFSENGTKIKSESIDGIGRLGGLDFTEKLFRELLKLPALNNAVNMDSKNESGLSEKDFLENTAILKDAAEKLKIMLSYDSRAVLDVNLNVPDKNQKQRVSLSVKRKPYEILIKEEILKLRNRIRKTVAECGTNIKDIRNVIITGGASVTPAIRNMVISMFSEYDCKIHYINYPTAVSRGAAVYANHLAEKNSSKQSISELTYDLGILTVGAYGERPVFKCLARAGTPLDEGGMTVTAVCSLTGEEKENNYCRLFLYRRPREYSHVESTFDPEGDVICPVGSLYISDFPEDFSLSDGKIKFEISFDSQECISADAYFCMPRDGSLVPNGSTSAVFMPYQAK